MRKEERKRTIEGIVWEEVIVRKINKLHKPTQIIDRRETLQGYFFLL